MSPQPATSRQPTKLERHLGMFAKYWEPGAVKTRLASNIGATSAAAVYREFVACLAVRFAQVSDHRVLSYWPLDRHDDFAKNVAGDAWQLEPQSSGDLGGRMASFFQRRFDRGAGSAVLIGSDSPTMRRETVEAAYTALDDFDVVLGPTEDGGYYLVGMSAPHVGIFDGIQWSTPAVWQQTVARLEQQGLRYLALPRFFDVDEEADLAQLRRDIRQFAGKDATAFERLSTVLAQLPDAQLPDAQLPDAQLPDAQLPRTKL